MSPSLPLPQEEVRAALRDGVDGVRVAGDDEREVWRHPETEQLHRLGGPALVTPKETSWFVAGVRHREDGPAEVTAGFERWWRYGQVHRSDGPAVVGPEETSWFVAGVRHRDDGPAEVTPTFERWWCRGEVHRVDGPAAVFPGSGARLWATKSRDVVTGPADEVELSRLYDEGLLEVLEQVLTLWEPGGPSAAELSAAVLAARS